MAVKASQRLTAWLFRNHRWFGIWPCVFVMMWGASGVLHPIMSRLSPVQAVMQVPQAAVQLHTALAPSHVLARANIEEVNGLRVVSFSGESYYQATPLLTPSPHVGEGWGEGEGIRRYFDVNTGDELVNGDVLYAQILARQFTGDRETPIAKTTLVTAFNDDYLNVNRLLPVYRVDFARNDGLRIYIETSPARAAALVDNTKATLGSAFLWMHTWTFMDGASALRKSLISLLLLATLLSALSGVWIYGFMWKRKTLSASHAPLRRWHRSVAIAVSLSTILFVVSAEWHLLGGAPRDVPSPASATIASATLLLPDSIRHRGWASINAVQVDGQTYYQVAEYQGEEASKIGKMQMPVGEHDHHTSSNKNSDTRQQGPATFYIRTDTGEQLANIEREHAISLATQYSSLPVTQIESVERVTRFEGEYGFINKRLPVWRVQYTTPDHAAYFVETSSGALATVVRNADRAEGYSFAYLHKYHWLDFAGKNARDIISALFALGNVLVAALGLFMFTKRFVRQPH